MKTSQELDYELKRMNAQKKDVVDINYARYNNEFLEKVAQHNLALKREKEVGHDKTVLDAVQDGAYTLHHQLKGRTIHIGR